MTGEVTEADEPNGPTGAEVPEGSAEAEVTGSSGAEVPEGSTEAEVTGSSGAEVPEGSAEAEVTGAEITGNSAGLSESREEVWIWKLD